MKRKRATLDLLHRYTNLAATIHLLRERKLTLLDPPSWDDKNDVYFMEEYKRCMRAETVLALCFAHRKTTAEAYHHWRVFANGSNGVCIQFDKTGLTSLFDGAGVVHGPVKYMSLDGLFKETREKRIQQNELPFLKGSRYRDEREYRALFIDRHKKSESYSISLDLNLIRRITLSPWLPTSLANAVKDTLRSIDEYGNLNVVQSTLRNNSKWKSIGRELSNGNVNAHERIEE